MLVLNEIADEIINEGGISTVRRTVQAKRNALSVAYALKLARDKNDPMAKKYDRFNRLRKKLKANIFKKYSGRAKMMARQKMSSTSSIGKKKKKTAANASTIIRTVDGSSSPSSK